MDETELCGACLLELPGEHFTWPGCQEPHRLHVSCLSGMLASLPRWPRVPPVEPELQEAICECLRAAHPNDPRDTLPHLDCPLCRQRWTDVPAICAAACALPRWPGTEAGAAQPQPGPSDQQQRPTRPPVAMVVCGGLEQREMEWPTFRISNTWFGEWQCRSEICAGTHTAVAEPVGVPTLWLRQRLPQVALPSCHCGSMPLTTVLFHNPAASPAAEDSWRATWTCLGCGIWDHFTRGPPTDAAALERVAELTDVETWSAWCDAPGRSAFWQQAFDFAKRTLTGLHMEGEQNCGSVGPPSNLGPTNSQLFVPLLLDAAGLLLNQAGAAWRAHELIGPGWERWTTVLRAAQPVRMSELADALQGELGLQGPGLRPDARRMNLISCVLWMSSVRTGPGNTATASLAEVVGNSCLHNGYLPSLVQEVLLAKYGGVDMSREVLQVADAVRAAQAPGPVLPSAAASTRTLSSASAPTARAPPQGFVQAANLVTGAGWSEAAQPQAPVVTPEDAVPGGFRGIAASESFDIGDDVDTSIETPAARATPSAPCDRDEAGGPPPAARQRREGPSELVSNETQLLEASEESSRMPVDGHSGLSQGMAAMDVSERAQHFCPVPGCPAAAGGRRPGWDTDGPGLRAHVDAHLLGQLDGLPPEPWMNRRGMVVCRICGRMVSRRCNGGVHRTCLATELSSQQAITGRAPQSPTAAADDLPSLMDICSARIETREFIGAGLLPAVEREFNKCTANVIAYSRRDAWTYVGTERDTPSHQRARTAWTEWFMFGKTCLLVLPGGKAKENRNNNLLANRLARWTAGERSSLWSEALRITKADQAPRRGRKRTRPDEQTTNEAVEKKREEVIELARRGLPGKAVRHASSQGLAPDTAETERTMRSKFVDPPPAQRASRRMPAPEANTITDEGVVRAVRSFDTGVGAGPTGQRPDFYKQLIGDKGDRPAVPLFTSLSNLLASGQAPAELRPFIGGAKGTALYKKAKDGTDDARPACSGETIRRVIGKVLLATDIEPLSDHLLPHQLAVGVKAGVEAMPHLVRQWRDDNAHDNDKVLINFDEGNAHNEVDRHTFLVRMREVAPGLCKWLEYIYPTDEPTHVFYRGRVIPSSSGCQQGCPLIGACHALVKRMVHESLGIVPVPEGSAVRLPRIEGPLDLDIAPLFADDGTIAGRRSEVWRALRHMKAVMPSVGLRFSLLRVVAAAPGQQTEESFAEFVAEGCVPVLDGNFEVLKSPIGELGFSRAYCQRVASKQGAVLDFLTDLGDPQVSHYLIKWCVNGSRMNYIVRTTPHLATCDAAAVFDAAVVDAFAASCNLVLSEKQRAQIAFPTKKGGMGVRTVADRADAAYVASRAATHELCRRIRPQHRGEHGNRDANLQSSVESLQERLPESEALTGEMSQITQSKLNDEIDAYNTRRWFDNAAAAEQVRLKAYSALGCGHEVDLVPSKTLDTNLSRGEFGMTVSRRLGVDVMEGDSPCGFCGQLMDAGGLHACSCMSGGDATAQHNAVRDVYFDFCERGALRPLSEAPRILQDVFGGDGRRRPADVLCMPALPLARTLPNGARAIRAEPVCFDFAVINGLGRDHWADTAQAPGSAADKYGEAKKTRNNTEALCADAGYRFWPVVHEVQGATSKAADAAIRAISDAVGQQESREPASVRRELLGRIAVVVARTAARAVQKRASRRPRRGQPSWAAVARALTEDDAPDGDEVAA